MKVKVKMKVKPKEDTLREDLYFKECAIALGFNVHEHGGTGNHLSFSYGNTRIWNATSGGVITWRVADIIDGRYLNYRSYNTLEVALVTERYR